MKKKFGEVWIVDLKKKLKIKIIKNDIVISNK